MAGQSIAIWCDLEKNNPPVGRARKKAAQNGTKIKVHFNLWLFQQDKRPAFLDVGIWFNEVETLRHVFIYFPHKFTQEDVLDLSSKFRDNTLATGIFNEALEATDKPDHVSLKHAEIDTNFVSVHKLAQNEFTSEILDGGTLFFSLSPVTTLTSWSICLHCQMTIPVLTNGFVPKSFRVWTMALDIYLFVVEVERLQPLELERMKAVRKKSARSE